MTVNKLSNFWIQISNWEFWPAWLFNIPVGVMWLIQAIRCRNFFFFSNVNPDIETGGFFSEEKWPIYEMFPSDYIPKGILIKNDISSLDLYRQVKKAGIQFPLLVKPNIGERGMGIEKIHSNKELEDYHLRASFQYIIQDFVSYPNEMSVLAYCLPDSDHVYVTSVCIKKKLVVVGDGRASLEELANMDYRSRIQWERLRHSFDAKHILDNGEKLLLEPIGNHSRGTVFLNGNHLIDESFRHATEQLFRSIRGEIFYGRFDIMYDSIESYCKLDNFKVIEFNGVGSEPAHIYQPGFSLVNAYRSLWRHAKLLGDISLIQKSKGVQPMSWVDFKKALKIYKTNLALVKNH